MYVALNGSLHGFFECKRGVRQGDPFSPLLFCLAGDFLSRHLSNFLFTKNLAQFKVDKEVCIPSHTLYADDILVFYKGKASNIIALKQLFSTYSETSLIKISILKIQ